LAGGDEMKKLLEKLETLVDEATLLVREERARRALAAAPTVQPFAPYVPSRTEEALWEFPPDVTCGGATTNKFPVPVPIAMTAWNANCGGSGQPRQYLVRRDRHAVADSRLEQRALMRALRKARLALFAVAIGVSLVADLAVSEIRRSWL
jgi:hypothetical protein